MFYISWVSVHECTYKSKYVHKYTAVGTINSTDQQLNYL